MAEADWPKAPVLYQIYPRSFLDSTGDGIGDLAGITSRLDHVAALGVDGIWLSPHYASPWDDGGYDITDHSAVEPRLGTLDDFDALVARAHDLGLLVMLDQVLNHTSCEHPWFLAALDGDDDMAERYLFVDPKPDGTPPNNWLSYFGSAGWSWAHRRRQYFFHQFLKCQPSLNLRNPVVQDAHRDQIKFWLDRGVDGFRFDAVTSYLWDESLADNPPATPKVQDKVNGPNFSPYTYQDHEYDMLPGDGADYAEKLREWAGEDTYLIGEISSGNKSFELAMAFSTPRRLNAGYTTDVPESHGAPDVIAKAIDQTNLQRFVAWMSCHDQPRHNRSGTQDEAMFFALLMAVLPGPWLIYQGEEWGLPQPELKKDEITDPFDLLYWPDVVGREGSRVPLPWAPGEPGMGFTTGTPWLPMRWSKDAQTMGQAIQAFYHKLIALRRETGLATGNIVSCDNDDTWLQLEIDTEQDRFLAWFGYPGCDRDPPKGDAMIEVSGKDYRAALFKL